MDIYIKEKTYEAPIKRSKLSCPSKRNSLALTKKNVHEEEAPKKKKNVNEEEAPKIEDKKSLRIKRMLMVSEAHCKVYQRRMSLEKW